jgi:undecaprenyl phosphate N,N'-diacetylbacillosamine 1-phosphate transferase
MNDPTETSRSRDSYCGKRALDVLAASTACAALVAAAAAVALAKWWEDGGPPLFFQSRVGRRRRPFTILKLRSMQGRQVTPVGEWLRGSGIDELPQLLNVCRGDMSLVGPRPLTGEDLRRLGWTDARTDWRFAVRPGITGLSQLFGGHCARASLRLDRLYLRKQSLSLDLQLIGLSFAANVFGKRTVRRWVRAARTSRAHSLGST